ncbi:MAG TPA: hypothetical protein VHE12_00820 [bacterium]|nr:hypothetical protein [bacterium]
MGIRYRICAVLAVLTVIFVAGPSFGFAATSIQILTPPGWVKVSLESIPTNDPSVPKSVLDLATDLAQEPTFKLVAYDPKAYKAQKSAVMYVQEIHFGQLSDPTEKGFLEGRGECYVKQAMGQDTTLVERRGFVTFGKFVERLVMEFISTKRKIPIIETTYMFIHGNNLYQVSFRVDKDTFTSYAPVFQGSLIGILKAIQ